MTRVARGKEGTFVDNRRQDAPLPGLAAQTIDPATGQFVDAYVVRIVTVPQG